MSRSAHLVTSPNLFDFFHAEVGRAVEERGTVVSREGVWYLTNLLVEKGHVEAANAPRRQCAVLKQDGTASRG